MNHFVLPTSEYNRDLNLMRAYIKQTATYLAKVTGEPFEKCVSFVKREIGPGGKFELKDPQIISLEQTSPGNREKVERTFMEYVNEVVVSDRILSPSMVVYERPEVNKSTSAAFVEGGIAGRKKAKGEMFKAKQEGDEVLEYIKDCEQNAKKIGINSISGMHGFSGNILYVKSGHSSLTSMCRTATGYGNANNEKFLTGSRHYWNSDIVMGNILTIVTSTDYALLQEAIDAYKIVMPTVRDTMRCIEHSTSLYWRNPSELDRIEELVCKLTDLERAAFVYSGDLYHLMVYNEDLVRGFMDQLTQTQEGNAVPDPDASLKKLDDDTKSLVNLLNAHILDSYMDDEGKRQSKTHKWVRENDPKGYMELAATADNVHRTLDDYKLLIKALWVPKHMPPTVANIRGIMRRTAIASDTDSTIFTTQEWVHWYTGSYKRTRKGDGIWYAVTYLTTQCIIHVLAQFSANMGVSKPDLHRLSMKNEYAFPVFSLTTRAKHYFAFMSAREGNVYAEYETEIKGVALRSSAVPIHVIKRAKELMIEIMTIADKGEKISLNYVYGVIYDLEMDIRTSIEKGEAKYLKTGQIKEKYKNMASSPYEQYLRWEAIFAPKYGSTPHPPYSVIRAPLEINNKTDMANWLASMEDRDIAGRMAKYMLENNRKEIKNLLLPAQVLGQSGMPKEVLLAIDIRKLTYQILESFYLLLESLGVYQVDSKFQRLVSDFWSPEIGRQTLQEGRDHAAEQSA